MSDAPATADTAMTDIQGLALLEDREDYQRWLLEYGFSKERIAALVDNEADQMPMPPKFDRVAPRDSPIHGKGLFAVRCMQAGELLAPARIDRKRTPAGRFTNHSTRPNAKLVRLRGAPDADIDLVATRPIAEGDELLVDYRQAGSVNGNNIWPDPNHAMETVRLRLRIWGGTTITPKNLDQCMTGVLTALRYIPGEFPSWVVSGRVSEIAAQVGYQRAGLYLGRTQWKESHAKTSTRNANA